MPIPLTASSPTAPRPGRLVRRQSGPAIRAMGGILTVTATGLAANEGQDRLFGTSLNARDLEAVLKHRLKSLAVAGSRR